MEYTSRTVKSRPGMTQEQALDSLQSHPAFVAGTKISSIRRRGKFWVAELLEPRTAGDFPPSDDDGGEGESPEPKAEVVPAGPSDSPSDDDGSGDGPPSDSPDESGPPKPGGEHHGEGGKGVENQILHTLQEILHALQGGAPEPGLGGMDDLGPDLGGLEGPPPPHGGGGFPPAGPPKPGAAGIGAKLKPGEVPNKPGVTPVGAPAFASTRQANPMPGAAPMGAPVPGAAPAPAAGGVCPNCGQPEPCACGYGQSGGLGQAMAKKASTASTFKVTTPVPMSVGDAVRQVQAAAPAGYSVQQARYLTDGRVVTLVTCR